jgi:hypothetical protein
MLNEPTFRKSGPIIQVIIELTPKGQCAASVALAADSDSEPAARRRRPCLVFDSRITQAGGSAGAESQTAAVVG